MFCITCVCVLRQVGRQQEPAKSCLRESSRKWILLGNSWYHIRYRSSGPQILKGLISDMRAVAMFTAVVYFMREHDQLQKMMTNWSLAPARMPFTQKLFELTKLSTNSWSGLSSFLNSAQSLLYKFGVKCRQNSRSCGACLRTRPRVLTVALDC